jgi:hypothetical protein
VIYDVKNGRVRWHYDHAKNSQAVGRFMQQVQRGDPTQQVWVVLDQDPTYLYKLHQTRWVIRALKLHWISLSKGSPDDNPVEPFLVIFSV